MLQVIFGFSSENTLKIHEAQFLTRRVKGFDQYLFIVHAQVGCSSRHRDTSFCQFDEVLLNPAGNLEGFERKISVLIMYR